MLRRMTWVGLPLAAFALISLADTPTASADGFSLQIGRLGISSGYHYRTPNYHYRGHSSHRYVVPSYRSYYPGSYYPGHYQSYRPHLDYYPGRYVPHGNHYDYVPGHYRWHSGPHYNGGGHHHHHHGHHHDD